MRIPRAVPTVLAALIALAACRRAEPPAPAAAPSAPAVKSDRDRDRRELTLQPRRDWKPEDAARRLRVQLIAEKSRIPISGPFRCRLEIQNVGSEAIRVREPAPSFIKDGSLCGAQGLRFYATPPSGSERELACDPAAAAAPGSALDLTLRPGDYLLTRPESSASRFRDLRTRYRFDASGEYRVRAVYEAAGLRAESNVVAITVTP